MKMEKVFVTSDLGLAAYLISRGGLLEESKTNDQGKKRFVEFGIKNVDHAWVQEYQNDVGGIQRFLNVRRFLLRMIHSEMASNNENGES